MQGTPSEEEEVDRPSVYLPCHLQVNKLHKWRKKCIALIRLHIKYIVNFNSCKNYNNQTQNILYFSYFCSTHIFWVHVRIAVNVAVLTSTHNISLEQK